MSLNHMLSKFLLTVILLCEGNRSQIDRANLLGTEFTSQYQLQPTTHLFFILTHYKLTVLNGEPK